MLPSGASGEHSSCIESCLSWNDQIAKVRKTICFKISLLRKSRHYLPLDTRKLFFNYYIKPMHLSYCSSIWGQTSKENHNRIIKLQKQAASLILNKDYTNPSAELFHEQRWIGSGGGGGVRGLGGLTPPPRTTQLIVKFGEKVLQIDYMCCK